MNILRKVADLATTATVTRGDQDHALWHTWKKSPTDANASALLKQVNPLVQREVNKWSGTLARPLLETEGKKLAMQSFHTYDPTKGAALGTHVVNQLQKMSRLSYANQNVARLPENKMLMFHSYNLGHATLQDELGRPPTADELADHLGWSINHLTKFRKETAHQELLESGGNEGSTGNLHTEEDQDHTVDFIHHDLPLQQKQIFEALTGYGGHPVMSNQEIQTHLGISQGVYSYQKKLLLDHIDGIVNPGSKSQ